MKKATAIILAGIMLLFLFSLVAGKKIFSAYERDLSVSSRETVSHPSTPAEEAARNHANLRKARLALSSFDLMAGLTTRDLENIQTLSLSFPFFFLLASFWLVLGLRRSKPEM